MKQNAYEIQRNGDLTDINLIKSSGYTKLDKAALTTLQSLSPFEPIPQELKRDQWTISVPLVFQLQTQ